MNIDGIGAIIFIAFLTIFLIKNRKKLFIQKILWFFLYTAMYKTKLGLKQMDSLSKKHPKTIDYLSKAGVFFGILGMVAIAWELIKNLYKTLLVPQSVPGVALVLPFKVTGAFFVPFFYWIISIFVIAGIHEFSHGVVARLHKIPVKSSGFAFFGILAPIIPAAFVEPDEKVLEKKTRMQKMSVYAAGPFSNLITGALFLILFLLISVPVVNNVIQYNGVRVEGYTNASQSQLAGLPKDTIITKVDGVQILTVDNLSSSLENKKIGESVNVTTTNGTYSVSLGVNPNNSSQSYLGVLVSQSEKNNPEFEQRYGSFTASAIIWLVGLFYFLFTLSLGIGLFNLVPAAIFDGGLMSKEICRKFFEEKTAIRVWHYISFFFLAVIVITIFAGFI